MAGGRSERPWIRLHTHRAHCTNACLVFTRKEEGSHWTWAFPGTERGQRSLRRGRGGGLAGLAAEAATAALGSPCPAAFHLLLPTCPRKGPPGPGLGGEGPSLSATQDY